MKKNPIRYSWLIGGLCVWLLCAWSVQRPVPVAGPVSVTDSLKTDPESGLAIDAQLPLVKAQCTACHSSKFILQSHFSREKWIERIRWMQRTQKLWDLGDSEPAILAYLTRYYGPTETPFDGRRLPLAPPAWHSR